MLHFALPDSPSYALAFSGGADSRLLLELTVRALLEREGRDGLCRLVALHLHHGIRGEEADRDEAFCREVCHALRVELICQRVSVPQLAEALGESLETAARRARYDFFRTVMLQRQIPTLLTAHHADDNLETVLAQLIRGSGTRGMGGIPSTRRLSLPTDPLPLVVHRPLLDWTRRDILAACEQLSLSFVTDSSNLETGCTRNRIRHTVIPALEAIAGEDVPQRSAARMSRAAEEDEAFLQGCAHERLTPASSPPQVSLADMQGLPPSLTKRMLMEVFQQSLSLLPDQGENEVFLSATQLKALLELTAKGVPESGLDLPGGIRATIREGRLLMRPAKAPLSPILSPHPIPLSTGRLCLDSGFTVTVESSDTLLSPLTGEEVFASAIFPPSLPLPLLLRRRREGDRILSHGMHKKLKKLLNEKSIPPHLRQSIPLLCLGDDTPLWYPRAAFRDGYPAPPEGPCLRITVSFSKGDPLDEI